VLKAVWEENRNCADRDVLAALVAEVGLPPSLLDEAAREEWAARRRADSEAALARGGFGAPSYVIGDEIFWGQDRLDFVARHLARGD
jgi:carboxymethylenebutenolidase